MTLTMQSFTAVTGNLQLFFDETWFNKTIATIEEW